MLIFLVVVGNSRNMLVTCQMKMKKETRKMKKRRKKKLMNE